MDIRNSVQTAIKNQVFPGAVVGIVAQGEQQITAFGHETYSPTSARVTATTVYDLASITKCIPTASLALHLIEQGKLSLDDRLISFLPQIKARYRNEIKIRHLLTYTVTFKLPRLSELAQQGGQAVMDACFSAELVARPGRQFMYSNIVATLLALVIEKVAGKKFTDLARQTLFEPLGMLNTTFTPKTATPTEVNRHGIITGQVHDESARALARSGLTVGHAGLFSIAADLLAFANMLLKNDGTIFKPATIEQMHTNQLASIDETFGLGWAMQGSQFNFFGNKVSSQAFGMTGFTGTSLLVDPVKNKALVILSNATFPKRKDDKEIINAVRREISNIVFG